MSRDNSEREGRLGGSSRSGGRMTVEEAGRMGGQKVARLIAEGKAKEGISGRRESRRENMRQSGGSSSVSQGERDEDERQRSKSRGSYNR